MLFLIHGIFLLGASDISTGEEKKLVDGKRLKICFGGKLRFDVIERAEMPEVINARLKLESSLCNLHTKQRLSNQRLLWNHLWSYFRVISLNLHSLDCIVQLINIGTYIRADCRELFQARS